MGREGRGIAADRRKKVAASAQARPSMQSPAPADILSYHARRRLRRAIQFVAATMRTTKIEEVSSTGAPVAELKYLPEVQVQLGAVRQPPESRGAGPLRPDIA